MHLFSSIYNPESIAAIVAIMAFVFEILRQGYKVVRKIDDTFTYVDELRTNHLPHLQRAIRLIAAHLGVDIEDD